MRSPLQIRTSKSAGVLKKIIPEGSTISSFFFYDGTVEVALANSNRIVVAHTNKYPVYEFWTTLIKDPEGLAVAAEFMHERLLEPEMYLLQENWTSYDKQKDRATFFYILSKCSEAGLASCGKIDKKRLNSRNITNLKRFKIKNLYPFYDNAKDPLEGIKSAKHTNFLFFPIGDYNYNLFDQGKNIGPDMPLINHTDIRNILKETDKKWVAVYNKHPAVFKLYKDENIIMVDKYGNITTQRQRCKEIIINNFVSI